MPAQRLFRIERQNAVATNATAGNDAAPSPVSEARILDAIGEIKALLKNKDQDSGEPANSGAENFLLEKYRQEMTEALKLKQELDSIHTAIAETKTEIASLHHGGFRGEDAARVRDELDQIVIGTEKATEAILSAAEIIDEDANNLAAKLTGDDQGMASDIQEKVVTIFEACNFQDLTGQRIGKVVHTLQFIEERVNAMMSIWGGIESFDEVVPVAHTRPSDGDSPMHGPPLPDEDGLSSQEDIDALFD